MACYEYAIESGLLTLGSKRMRLYRYKDERITRVIDLRSTLRIMVQQPHSIHRCLGVIPASRLLVEISIARHQVHN